MVHLYTFPGDAPQGTIYICLIIYYNNSQLRYFSLYYSLARGNVNCIFVKILKKYSKICSSINRTYVWDKQTRNKESMKTNVFLSVEKQKHTRTVPYTYKIKIWHCTYMWNKQTRNKESMKTKVFLSVKNKNIPGQYHTHTKSKYESI